MDNNLWEQRKEVVAEFLHSKEYHPMKFKEIAAFLQVPKEDREEFRLLLEELIASGKLVLDQKGRYKTISDETKSGIFCGTQKGFGFVTVEGEPDDIFIPEAGVGDALHGDKVQVRISAEQKGKRREGVITAILERNTKEIVGTYQKSKNYGFVVPDNNKFNTDIFVPKEWSKGAVSGHKVLVKLTSYGDKRHSPEGRVDQILGHINDPGVDILSVIKAYELPEEFPADVLRETEQMPEVVEESEMGGRVDLRGVQTVTIDGEDAKDLDDAISLSKEERADGKVIYHLGVHIADVTNYVKEGSALDREALKRGTSVYLVDRVIPMLPHRLSNGICSLNQGTDRLALSCLMDIDEKGTVTSHRIAETVVKVDRRMSYTAVKGIVEDQDSDLMKEYEELTPMFFLMEELAEILRKKRRKRGSIDFDFPESKITLDERGKPVEIAAYERNKATRIIEDFMLAANETVAEDYFWQELPFVYRSHENPDMEKMEKLRAFLQNFGYSIRMGQDEIHPKELQKLIENIEGKPEEALISRITLRSMKQAKYTVEGEGHFGLAARYYCHFTSPIRRYPDLQIHRIIKENLRGGLSEKRIRHYDTILPEVADRSSRRERLADEAEREVEKMKKAEYMRRHIGEIYEGVISGISSWGIYVELPNTVEGMVRVSDLRDDYYYYDEALYQMVGEHTKKVYKLGQRVAVEVIGSDKLLKTIDFELVPDGIDAGRAKNDEA